MLDVRDMSKEDKSFNFLSGLQTWAQMELRRQGIKDLPSVIAAADRLVDFRVANSSDLEKKKERFWVNPMQLVSALQERPPKQKGLMYVRVQINGKAVITMLDLGATHNFVADREIQKLGLTLAQHSSRIKVTSEAKPIQGVACVELKVSAWTGKCNLMVVLLDDFDLIRGMDFLLLANAMEFKDVFPPELPKKLHPRRAIDHAIELEPGARPSAQTPYRMAPEELAELRKQLDGLLEARLVQPSKAPYGSPVLFQRKQDGSMRMCVDYRALNKIDLRSGYWQVRVARGDEPKTTCVTILVVVYLDDIVIYSETLNEHVKHLRAVFQRLREYELYAKKEKYEFCCEPWACDQPREDSDGPKKGTSSDGLGIPSKIAYLRSFLGLVNYYRRFIKGYSKIVNPLKDLLRKDQKWEWTFACDDAFTSLKQAISSQPVLKLPQFDKPFEVQVHASDRALGARWQSFWKNSTLRVYRSGKHNNVVESDFLDQNRESSKTDAGYLKLVEQVLSGLVRKETHDPQWAEHPGIDRMEKKKEAGLLQPLPIPEVLWQSISMDFISGFLKVNGMASVLVVVDRFSKDARFTRRFWTALFNMMGTELKFSTANHPQTDGQTERVNALVEDYLRDYVSASQRNWVDLLDVPQFSYNLHKSSATELLDEAKDSLAKAQRRMKKYADMGRRHVQFSVGDQVLLKLTPQIWKKISSKSVHRGLIPKYDRPFEDLLDTARQQTQRALPVIQKEFEKTMLKNLDHRTMGQSKKNRQTDYLVHWSGESEANATWERDVTLWQFEEKLNEYWAVREGVRIKAWDNVGMERHSDGQSDKRSALELDGSAQGLLTRAVTLGRLRTVSKSLSGGSSYPITAVDLGLTRRRGLLACYNLIQSKLKTSAVRLRERADWFRRNQAAQWAE
ncbi:Transposon Ty3-I Gag-Pol polyprotein [Sesamum angolense]|uniref:Transposon Ty3-I Gag-Pol polyprotein n=1 Tax=Sesamum angolense TaxID=2727404 RepID=A0AAE1T7F4_9LAMI|nr:Transposon Ty3-I Gag-Pol polyprotein [Sesamum angolense]